MRAVVQRVRWARVTVEGELVGEIGRGLLVYLGVGQADSEDDTTYLSNKIAGLRVFPLAERPMERSVVEEEGEVLVVSQFTLYGDCRKGRRPSFSEAMEPQRASELIEGLMKKIEEHGVGVAGGRFRAMMDVESLNWGPVTILLDSKKGF